MIGITLPEDRKVGSFSHKIDSCFLIETKFIFVLLEKFRRQNESQEIPRLRLLMISLYHHIKIIEISDFQIFKFQIFKISKFQRFKDSLELEKMILFSLN